MIKCPVCKKISVSDDGHLDCLEKRRIELEDDDFKSKLPEKLNMMKGSDELGSEIKALLDHIAKDKKN